MLQFQSALAAALALGRKSPSRFVIPVQLFVDRGFVFILKLYFYNSYLMYFHPFYFLFHFIFNFLSHSPAPPSTLILFYQDNYYLFFLIRLSVILLASEHPPK